MKLSFFVHSIISDWNNGNAHFQRGVVTELCRRGHQVTVYEPQDNWSIRNLSREQGEQSIANFSARFPSIQVRRYGQLKLAEELRDIDIVIVHEWNDPSLTAELGQLRRNGRHSFRLLFHDTHHRGVTDPQAMAQFDLREFDGVLTFGQVLRDLYLKNHWCRRAWTWHEGADLEVFQPAPAVAKDLDVIWIGNWGDGERAEELQEFLVQPIARLGLRAAIHGVRYSNEALRCIRQAGIEYRGWIPNAEVPRAFASAHVTIHVPRRPYTASLPGIPTIRPFEAMACAIPLISGPWADTEHLFTPGIDYFSARNGSEVEKCLSFLLENPSAAVQLGQQGRKTITAKHGCNRRVDELLKIISLISSEPPVDRELAEYAASERQML